MNEANGIWIPAEVWALDLPVLHRVFLARLLSLSKQQGASWAGDEFLAESLRCTPQNVRKMRRQLEESGHIVTEGYGHNRRLSVELAPVVARVAPRVTSNASCKQPELQELQPQLQKLQPELRQEATAVAYSKEEKRTSKEEVKREETEPERMRRLIEEKEARERGEYTETPKAVVTIPARGAARPAVVSNKAKPFDAEEVRDYFVQLGDPDPDEAYNFWDHFESNGWLVSGKTPMRDWKASVRKWMRSEFRKPRKKSVGERVREMMERDELNKNR
jgi:hypothetical protein